MVKNMGTVDRVLRVLFAVVVAILLAAGALKGAGGIILGILGAIFLVTAAVGTCPIYLPFKLSTRRRAS